MTTALIAVGLALVAVAVAALLARRRPRPMAPPPNWHVPTSIDRRDFPRPEAPWLVLAFTSATCQTCAAAWTRVRPLGSDDVAVAEVESQRDARLHERYGIDAVPLVLVADAQGAVQAHYLGPFTATDLWGTVAELREPGTLPPGCGHGSAPA